MYFYLPTESFSEISTIYADHFVSMRVKPGHIVRTTDLNGTLREIKITEIDKKANLIKFQIINSIIISKKKSQNILIQAITDKIYLEKLIEIAPHANIDIIYLFHSERSPIGSVSMDRLERILLRSCEQAEKAYKPKIKIIDKLSFLEKIDSYKPVVLEIPNDINVNIFKLEKNNIWTILVGPEGGWSANELSLFENKKLAFDSLGSTVYPSWLAGYTWFIRKLDK
jgi:16S rRNA (uracil1498-N3)-methyltransferase